MEYTELSTEFVLMFGPPPILIRQTAVSMITDELIAEFDDEIQSDLSLEYHAARLEIEYG
jgi:hypothetical protein